MQRKRQKRVDFSNPRSIGFNQLLDAWLPVFEEADTPVALAAYLRLKYGDHLGYCQMVVDPADYTDPRKFFLDYQCVKLFSKYDRLNTGINTTRVAAQEFARCEQKCRLTNRKIRNLGFRSLFSDEEWPVIYRATRIIQSILGSVPDVRELDCYFGPGGSVGLDITKTSSYDKLSAGRSITADLLALMRATAPSAPRWDACTSGIPDDEVVGPFWPLQGWDVVPGSRLSFVPKNAKTDRPICIEPLYNGYVQLGIGRHLRNRLKRVGVDLDDQTKNQELARLGSITGDELATLDLKSASDLIAYEVVKEMLPFDWFFMLASARSPTFQYEDRTYPLAKFSSMGNGYTFELESLIFYGVSLAARESLGSVFTVSVYGDDIICPTEAAPLTISLLEKLGFEVSTSKSFVTGPFRESCGKDYFDGVNVRPYFQKTGSLQAVTSAHNNVALRHSSCFGKTARRLKYLLPPELRNYGPWGYGDGHLVTGYRPKADQRYKKRGWDVVSFNSVVSQSIRRRVTGAATFSYALYKGTRNARVATDPKRAEESRDANFHVRRDDVRYNIKRLHLPWREPIYLTF